MKYLSIDIEATGLDEHAHIIEFGMIPFSTDSMSVEDTLAWRSLVKCPPFEVLLPKLDPWVVQNNKKLIEDASKNGITIDAFKEQLESYLSSSEVKKYFGNEKIVIFGKSLNAIDLPFLNRDLGWEWVRKYFHHRTLDLSSYTLGLIDMNILGKGMDSGTNLMRFLGMGNVCHTALEDAKNSALMYLALLKRYGTSHS